MRKFLLVAAILISAVACGATGVGTGSNPSPTASPGSGLHFDVTATEKDHAVTMRVGQKLQVVLHGGNAMRYQQVRSSDETILQPAVHPAATAAIGVTLAAFVALKAGTADVTAVATAVCPSGTACPMYAVLYTLTVTVTP